MAGRFLKRWPAFLLTFSLTLVLAAPVLAAFPGQNGKIAFNTGPPGGPFNIEVINPDGTGRAILTTGLYPTWSPDGTRLAFLRSDGLYIANADGSNATRIVPGDNRMNGPAWSPDGTQVAYGIKGLCDPHEPSCFASSLLIANVDGTGIHTVPAGYRPSWPDWSPDGTKFIGTDDGGVESNPRLFTVNVDGSNLQYPTSGNAWNEDPSWSADGSRYLWARICCDSSPSGTYASSPFTKVHPRPISTPGAWAPDGSRIALGQCVDMSYPCPQVDLILVNPNGGGEVNITNDAVAEFNPDWQPIPINAYPRPVGASPVEVSLVPAYQPCSAPNRAHGPPLGFGSCNPPAQQSGQLTVGTPDANGQGAKSLGYLRIGTLPGNPTTPADEADVRLWANITDVRMRSDLSDYTGDLGVRLAIQITDKNNTPHPGGPGAATVEELTHSQPIPCTGTDNTTVGSTCQVDTTVEALVPGAVVEKRRAIWELGAVRVHDGAGNLFMTQGLFVP